MSVPPPASTGPLLHSNRIAGAFPAVRMRRLRGSDWVRRLVQEHRLSAADLIWPIFISPDPGRQPIPSLPGVDRIGLDELDATADRAVALGIPAIALFPATPSKLKTDDGREAVNPDNLICTALRQLKQTPRPLGLIADVALDPYTSHGHDGLIRGGRVDNDSTLDILAEQAVVQAAAGADVIAPSDMMDGRIARLRSALDQAGHCETLLLSYAAKFASSFYGPFRDAVGSSGNLTGDKRTYQMNPANGRAAVREALLDVGEGADLLMVKPGLAYLDIVHRVKSATGLPTFAYQVSGEYAMHAHAAEAGAFELKPAVLESLMAFKRAGADAVLTYFAPQVAEWLADSI